MNNFVCNKCGCTDYEIKEVSTHHGLYCAKCGQWYKWLNKKELNYYEKGCLVRFPRTEPSPYNGMYNGEGIVDDTLLYYLEDGHIKCECFNNKFPEQLEARLKELQGEQR